MGGEHRAPTLRERQDTIPARGHNLNLIWLQYVCYALLACAAILFLSSRSDISGLARPIKIAACATCIFLAALSWEFQEYNADVHSPRRLISGQVVLLVQNPHRGGSFDDDLQIELADGHLTPIFTTGTLANDISKQPIHKDDALRILYRTWDNEPLAIDEFSGANPGWKYLRPSQADWTLSIYSSIIALFCMAWLLKEYLRSRRGDELAYPDDTGNTQPSDVQTLGL